MYLYGYLLDCLFDFGLIYLFWLFSFERENGIFGFYLINRKSIEIQIMKKYLKESWVREKQLDFDDDFLCLFNDLIKFYFDSVCGILYQ